MDTTIAAETATDETIPVADLLRLVCKYATDEGWCDDVETYLGRLGLTFEPTDDYGCSCRPCRWEAENSALAPRFTLAEGAPEVVPKAALADLAAMLELTRYRHTVEEIVAEAVALFGLKTEAER